MATNNATQEVTIDDLLNEVLRSRKLLADQTESRQVVLGEQESEILNRVTAEQAQIPVVTENKKQIFNTTQILGNQLGMNLNDVNGAVVRATLGISKDLQAHNAIRDKIRQGESVSFWEHPIDWVAADLARPGLREDGDRIAESIGQAAAEVQALSNTFSTATKDHARVAIKLGDQYWIDEQKRLLSESNIAALKEREALQSNSIEGIKAMLEGDISALSAVSAQEHYGINNEAARLSLNYARETEAARKELQNMQMQEARISLEDATMKLRNAKDPESIDNLTKQQQLANSILEGQIKQEQFDVLGEKNDLDISLKRQKLGSAFIRDSLKMKKYLDGKDKEYSKVGTYAIPKEDKTLYYLTKHKLSLLKPVDVARLKKLVQVDDKTFVAELSADGRIQENIRAINDIAASENKFAHIQALATKFKRNTILRNEKDFEYFKSSLNTEQNKFLATAVNNRLYQDYIGVPDKEKHDVFGKDTFEATTAFSTIFPDYIPQEPEETKLLSELKTRLNEYVKANAVKVLADGSTVKATKEDLEIGFNLAMRNKAIEDAKNVEGGGTDNFYHPIPTLLAAGFDKATLETRLYKDVIEKGLRDKSLDDNAESIVSRAIGAVQEGHLTTYDINKELSTLFRAKAIAKNYYTNHAGYHLPGQSSYNVVLDMGTGASKLTYNLLRNSELVQYIAAVRRKNSAINPRDLLLMAP